MTKKTDTLSLETRRHYAASLDGRSDEVYDAAFEALPSRFSASITVGARIALWEGFLPDGSDECANKRRTYPSAANSVSKRT